MNLKPTSCRSEPPYPLPQSEHVVIFSLRAPDHVAHRKHRDCNEEYPHLISECGMFEQEAKQS